MTLTLSFFASVDAGATETETVAGPAAGVGAKLVEANAGAGAALGNTPNCATFAPVSYTHLRAHET